MGTLSLAHEAGVLNDAFHLRIGHRGASVKVRLTGRALVEPKFGRGLELFAVVTATDAPTPCEWLAR